ncbi:MAG: fimbria/pilus periplasmic chaperone [Byssovorax sp.]
MLGARVWTRLVSFAALSFALLQGAPAWAASFEVNPVRVALSSTTSSGLIAVHNLSTEPLRFQAVAYAWTQGPAGDMQLAPTDDVVVFPTMFTIKPGELRNMRIGTVTQPTATEKTYRVFVDELPPLQTQLTSTTIRVLTRMAIPVFVGLPTSKPVPRVDGLSVQQGKLAFALRNLGSAFFMARHVRVAGLATDGSTVFTHDLPAWYVLAGGLRAYDDALPDGACSAVRLTVDVETETTAVHSSVALSPGACAR